MKQNIYKLYVGLNDKDTKAQKIETLEAYKMVENVLLNNGLTGYTIYKGLGLYKHESGAITQETTLIIELLFTTDEIVSKVLEILKQVLNQESIMLSKQEISVDFR